MMDEVLQTFGGYLPCGIGELCSKDCRSMDSIFGPMTTVFVNVCTKEMKVRVVKASATIALVVVYTDTRNM